MFTHPLFTRKQITRLLRTAPLVGLISLIPASGPATAGDQWSQWRGPERTAILPADAALPTKLSGEGSLETVWKAALGPSYSGPVVSDGLVVTTETVDAKLERVTAFELETGKVRWTTQWEGAMSVPFFAKKNGDWIRATPAIADGKVYVAGMKDLLVCLDLKTGEEIWRCDFTERYKTAVPAFGFASSPLVDAGFVYVQAGEALCKLDANTGETVWRSLQGNGGMDSAFSSPIFATLHGVRQLVVQTREALCGLNPEDGKVYWTQPIEAFRGMNILTPTIIGNRIFTSAYGGRANLWEISLTDGKWDVAQIWDEKHQAYMASPVVLGGHLYLHLRNTRFTCVDLETGEGTWITQPTEDYWSMIGSGDRILALSSNGTLRLIEATPEEYRELDSFKIADDSWAHVAVSGNLVLIRDIRGLKVCRFE